MDATENPVLEPGAERITRCKAERRRGLAESYGNAEELPDMWVRREEKEHRDPESRAHAGTVSADGERKGGVTNGEVEPRTAASCSGR